MKRAQLNSKLYSMCFDTTSNNTEVLATALNIKPSDILHETYKTSRTSEGYAYFIETITVK